MVGTPSRMSLRGGKPYRMSSRCWVSLPDIREWSAAPPECLRVVRRPSWIPGSGCLTLPDVREWSGDLPDVREW